MAMKQLKDWKKLEKFLRTLPTDQYESKSENVVIAKAYMASQKYVPLPLSSILSCLILTRLFSHVFHTHVWRSVSTDFSCCRGNFKDMFILLESQQFSTCNHKSLQDLWYKAHYALAEEVCFFFILLFWFLEMDLKILRLCLCAPPES